MDTENRIEQTVKSSLIKLKEGDSRSATTIVETLGPRLLAFLQGILNNTQDAQDVLQETFMKIVSKIDTFNPATGSATAWVYTIARNHAIQTLRRRKTFSEASSKVSLPLQKTPEAIAVEKEEIERVGDALSRIPLEQRVVLLMREFLSMSYAQIAELTGESVGNTASEICRARAKLRELLRDRNE